MKKIYKLEIRHLRSEHLQKFVELQGFIRAASEVRPQCLNASFKCSKCRTTIEIKQIEKTLREPAKCKCGNTDEFILVSKEMTDAMRITVEEFGNKSKQKSYRHRVNVFLMGDLCDPKYEKITKPGSEVIAQGILTEIPIILENGNMSTRFDWAIESTAIEKFKR